MNGNELPSNITLLNLKCKALVTDGSGGNLRRLPRILEDALEIYNTEAGLVEGVVITASVCLLFYYSSLTIHSQ
jgi:hypothetical protein